MHVPPFIKRNEAVSVHVDLLEEARQSRPGDGQARALEGRLELILIEASILVPVDRLEQHEQLSLGGFDKNSEL